MAVYEDLAARYRAAIVNGELPPGHRFPIQPELAEEHSVALGTVHRFMLVLRREGLVFTTHDGTYVGPRPPLDSSAPCGDGRRSDRRKNGKKWRKELDDFLASGAWQLEGEYPSQAIERMKLRCTACGRTRRYNVGELRMGLVCSHRNIGRRPRNN